MKKIIAVIVAGGLGTRLRPLTNSIPKPMIKIADKPILEHVINLFKKNGINKFVIALCYLPETVVNYFGDGSSFGVSISYTFENTNNPLGTAGAILPTKNSVSDNFIVTYADTIRKLDILEMIKFHKKSKSLATINTYKHKGKNHKSTLHFDKNNKLTKFEENKNSENLKSDFVWSNGSFYIFSKEIFKYIPKNKKVDFSTDIFPKLLSLNKKISVFPSNDYFIDIGTKETLKKVEQDNDSKKKKIIGLTV